MITGTAIVTGAGSGIGRALAHGLADRGVRVFCTDVDGASAEETARSCGGDFSALDVTNASAFGELVARVDRDHGLAYLFNNAGIAVGGEAQSLGPEDWQRVLDVNLRGTIHGVTAAYPRMLARGRGHILNVASIAGLVPYPLSVPYTTSKHAVVGLSLALRAEGAARGVRVSVACPGTIDTAIWHRSEVRGFDRQRVIEWLGKPTTAKACANAILRGVEKNRGVIVVGNDARLAWLVQRASPRLGTWLHTRLVGLARERFVVKPAEEPIRSPAADPRTSSRTSWR